LESSNASQGSLVYTNQRIVANLGNLTLGAWAEVTAVVRVTNNVGILVNRTEVTSATTDVVPANNLVVTETTVTTAMFYEMNGGSIQISWPQSANNFVLESTTQLSPGAEWTPVNASTSVIGGNNVIQVPLHTNGTVFYRLRWVP